MGFHGGQKVMNTSVESCGFDQAGDESQRQSSMGERRDLNLDPVGLNSLPSAAFSPWCFFQGNSGRVGIVHG